MAASPCDEDLLRECVRVGLAAIRSRYSRVPLADAEDIVQDLVVSYLECPERIKVPEAWFFACAARRAHRFLLSRRMIVPIPPDLAARETGWEARFISRQLLLSRRAVSRVLLGRLFIAGFTAREIARAETCTTRSVEQHAAKLLKVLRDQVASQPV